MDHLIKNVHLSYRSWKYWHSPANHGKALAIVVAYDMYLECCEGELDPDWCVKEPVDFHTFRDILSKQMCRYDPKSQLYPGDEKMRAVTQMNKAVRQQKQRKIHDVRGGGNFSGKVTHEQYSEARRQKRFCSDLTQYQVHVDSIKTHKSKAKCAVCGLDTWKKCKKCGAPLHFNQAKGEAKGKNCHMIWHNQIYLGLCFGDRNLVGKTKNDWKPWTKIQLCENTHWIENLKAQHGRGRNSTVAPPGGGR